MPLQWARLAARADLSRVLPQRHRLSPTALGKEQQTPKPLQCLINHSEVQHQVPKIKVPPPNLGTSINRLIYLFLSPPWHCLAPRGFQGGTLFLGMLEQASSTRCKKPNSSCIPDLPWVEVRVWKRRSCSSSPIPGGESPPSAAGAWWLASGSSSSY